MPDGCFLALLNDVVSVRRRHVGLTTMGNPRTPSYTALSEDVPCALQPLSDDAKSTVMGAVELATHVAYAEPIDLLVGDLLVEQIASGELAEGVAEGAEAIRVAGVVGLCSGTRLEVGAGERSELAVAREVADGVVSLGDGLGQDHAAGERVRSVGVYEVVGVRDECGLGHHLRADVRLLRS